MPSKYLLFILTFFCVGLMALTFGTSLLDRPLNTVAGFLVTPLQKGISRAGSWMAGRGEELASIRELLSENEALKAKVAALTEENTQLQQDKYELNELRALMELDEQYQDYEKVGARIIARDSGNWYSVFILDKGSNQGLALDMNVLAEGGLVGRITNIGPDWSQVTAIISDNSNVSAMTLASGDNMIVSGDLKLMEQGIISFGQLVESADRVAVGDKVVTSNISDKYLPGILVGYIHTIQNDANNLTKSGYLTPAVDFEHLQQVLVITKLKQTIASEQESE